MVSTCSQAKQGIEAHSPLCPPVLSPALYPVLGGGRLGVFVAHVGKAQMWTPLPLNLPVVPVPVPPRRAPFPCL